MLSRSTAVCHTAVSTNSIIMDVEVTERSHRNSREAGIEGVREEGREGGREREREERERERERWRVTLECS